MEVVTSNGKKRPTDGTCCGDSAVYAIGRIAKRVTT